MATTLLLIFLLFTSPSQQSHHPTTSPYLSPHTFFPNYHKMLHSFKIYIYPHKPITFIDPAESAFYSTLLTTQLLTSDPDSAHLFFIPFISSTLSSRSISRHIRDIRSTAPYWNRTLGADHFYLHCSGLGYQSDRNLVELKKNAIQISCFPTSYGHFIPHKDITLPPPLNPTAHLNSRRSKSNLVNDLVNEREILTDLSTLSSEAEGNYYNSSYKYCLLSYDDGSVAMIGEALMHGCVPVVVAAASGGGMLQDLPMMGVVRWAEMAVFVGGGGVSGKEVRRVLREVGGGGGGYERMRVFGAAAARHFAWTGDRYDAFHTVMYQLWVKRHTIRYARFNIS